MILCNVEAILCNPNLEKALFNTLANKSDVIFFSRYTSYSHSNTRVQDRVSHS